jgi:hypothetical protein
VVLGFDVTPSRAPCDVDVVLGFGITPSRVPCDVDVVVVFGAVLSRVPCDPVPDLFVVEFRRAAAFGVIPIVYPATQYLTEWWLALG